MSEGTSKTLLWLVAIAVGLWAITKALARPTVVVSSTPQSPANAFNGAVTSVTNQAGIAAGQATSNILGTISNGIATSLSGFFRNSTSYGSGGFTATPVTYYGDGSASV